MKQILLVLFLYLIAFSVYADESDMNRKVLAPTFIVVDADDPEHFIYAKKPDMKIMPASTTKIMTCILALEQCPDLSAIVPVPDTAVRLKSTNTLMGLKRGEALPLIDLLYGMMLPSGNDAAIAVATYISGSVEQFAELMNAKAAELGMENTHFTNASGVYNGKHYSTARDMLKLAVYALKNEMFRTIVSTAEYIVPGNDVRKSPLHLVNTNRLVSDPKSSDFYYEYAIGCKTGSTEKGGKCLVAAAEKDGVTLVAVLLGVKDGGDKSTRIRRCFSDSKMMFQTIYETMYREVSPADIGIGMISETVQVGNATKKNGETGALVCEADETGASKVLSEKKILEIKENPNGVTTQYQWNTDKLAAPIENGSIVGNVKISYQGVELFELPLSATRTVEAYSPEEDITPTPFMTATPELSPAVNASETPIPENGQARANVSPALLIVIASVFSLIVVIVAFLLSRVKKG